jgi:DNA processing protein
MIKSFNSDKNHPDRLFKCDPEIGVPLYIKGELTEIDRNGVAIVGSRKPALYGIRMADKIAETVVKTGKTVISGLARGIDSEAHRAALKYGGRTIAVLGSGIDVIYPEENIGLANEIVSSGALISQFSEGTPPLRNNFPIRNKTVAKLCCALVVVQASLKSGSLLTARLALEAGKKVFVVPGEIDDPNFSGNSKFLEKHKNNINVEPLLSVEGLLNFLEKSGSIISARTEPDDHIFEKLSDDEKKVAELILKHETGIDFDTLSIQSSLSSSELPSILLSLTMMNLISESPGKIFQFTGDMK